jgi:hypothetical protein
LPLVSGGNGLRSPARGRSAAAAIFLLAVFVVSGEAGAAPLDDCNASAPETVIAGCTGVLLFTQPAGVPALRRRP